MGVVGGWELWRRWGTGGEKGGVNIGGFWIVYPCFWM